jgi:hypothetical protein
MPCTSPGKGAGKGRAGDQGGAARGEQGGGAGEGRAGRAD